MTDTVDRFAPTERDRESAKVGAGVPTVVGLVVWVLVGAVWDSLPRQNPEFGPQFFYSFLVGAVASVFIHRHLFSIRLRKVVAARIISEDAEAAQQRLQREEDAKRQEKRLSELLASQRATAREDMKSLVDIARRVQADLGDADAELGARAYAPFWSYIERIAMDFARARMLMARLSSLTAEHCELCREHDIPVETIISGDLPPFDGLSSRFDSLVRAAQCDFQFAQIWEHRQTRAAVVEGFATLGDAVMGLGAAVAESLGAVRTSIDAATLQYLAASDDRRRRDVAVGEKIDSTARDVRRIAAHLNAD